MRYIVTSMVLLLTVVAAVYGNSKAVYADSGDAAEPIVYTADTLPADLALLVDSQARSTLDDDTATVTVAHFAPFAGSVAGTSVTVRVDGEPLLPDFVFGQVEKNLELPEGTYFIEIVPTGATVPAIAGEVKVKGGSSYVLAAIGDGANQELELLPLVEDTRAFRRVAKLRLAHLAPFAAGQEATSVNVCTDDGKLVYRNIRYGDVLDVFLFPRVYDLKVVPTANGCGDAALDLPPVVLEGGDVVDLYVIGTLSGLPLSFTSITGVDLVPATVSVAHFAPFASSVDETSVTVRVNGIDQLTDFKFGEVAAGLELPPGNYTIEIIPSGAPAAVLTGEVPLESGKDYTLAAIGDVVNQDLELLARENNNDVPAKKAKARIGHLAPFAQQIGNTAVNVCSDDGSPVLENVLYKDIAELELDPGIYDLKVVLAADSCGDPVLDLPAVELKAREVVDVYVIGNIALPLTFATTTGVTVVPDPELNPAKVTIAHFAPFARPRIATSVSVLANGQELLTNFVFGQIERNLTVPAGTYQIDIVPTGTNSIVLSESVVFAPDRRYFVAAIGGGRFLPLELLVLEYEDGRWRQGRALVEDGASLRLAHLAPLASKLDDTRVDLCTDSGTLLVENVLYKAYATLTVPAGVHDLKVSTHGSGCANVLLDLPVLDLAAGDELEVFTVGDNDYEPLQALIDDEFATGTNDATNSLFLPMVQQ